MVSEIIPYPEVVNSRSDAKQITFFYHRLLLDVSHRYNLINYTPLSGLPNVIYFLNNTYDILLILESLRLPLLMGRCLRVIILRRRLVLKFIKCWDGLGRWLSLSRNNKASILEIFSELWRIRSGFVSWWWIFNFDAISPYALVGFRNEGANSYIGMWMIHA